MVIGPVSAIRPVTGIRSFPGSSDISRVTETQHRDQSRDDEYTPSDRESARGLEDEEEEELAGDESPGGAASTPVPGKVNFFA